MTCDATTIGLLVTGGVLLAAIGCAVWFVAIMKRRQG